MVACVLRSLLRKGSVSTSVLDFVDDLVEFIFVEGLKIIFDELLYVWSISSKRSTVRGSGW